MKTIKGKCAVCGKNYSRKTKTKNTERIKLCGSVKCRRRRRTEIQAVRRKQLPLFAAAELASLKPADGNSGKAKRKVVPLRNSGKTASDRGSRARGEQPAKVSSRELPIG